MKRLSLVLTLAALALPQAGQAVTWQKTFEGGEGHCVQETSDSNYIITGRRNGDLWLFKTDTLGNAIWEQFYEAGVGTYWVEETRDGDFVISLTPGLLKTDHYGEMEWIKDFAVRSYCVQETSDEGYLLAATQGTYSPLVLFKTNAQGDSLWLRTYEKPGNNINIGLFIEETADSGFIVTGGTGIGSEEYEATALWLIKTNSEGDTLWTKEFGGDNHGDVDGGQCVRQTGDGGYIITGFRRSGGFWLLKTDENGDTLWTRTYGGESGNSALETSDGNYVVVGRGPAENPWLSFYDDGDVLLVKVDAYGNTIWQRHHGGDDVDAGYCVAQTSDGGYIITGWSGSFIPVGLYLLKTDSLGFVEAIAEEPIPESPRYWELASPVCSRMVLRFWNQPHGFHASVFDASGRKVDAIKTTTSAGTLTWGEGFPSGVYFIQVKEKQQVSSAKVVLVR